MSQKQISPKFGVQSPVIAFLDPWAKELSDEYMRTGTGSVYPSQDPTPPVDEFINVLSDLGIQFYVHHHFPRSGTHIPMMKDLAQHDIEFCLGNEYGNINGPFMKGTNRYDISDQTIVEAASSGKFIGLLYDEPEHLQINASQYKKDAFLPHWGETTGLTLEESYEKVVANATDRVEHVEQLLQNKGYDGESKYVISEHVFPTMFHTHARAGIHLCAKTLKESFQSLQLSTALGASKQYNRDLWLCTDLWGPDTGKWFTRTSGLPGHSPKEYASALRMGYLMSPTRLFTENIDGLVRYANNGFLKTEFGEIWQEFIRKFVPENPLYWTHKDANPDIVFIHSDDSNYGQNTRLFGNEHLQGEEYSESIFHVWHLLSHGSIPAHGSCMHIPGYDFPRHELKKRVPREKYPLLEGTEIAADCSEHKIYYPVNNVIVYDERVREEQMGNAKVYIVAGSRLTDPTLHGLRKKAQEGSTVIIGDWLLPSEYRKSEKLGNGYWYVTQNYLEDSRVKEWMAPFIGTDKCWMQRFNNYEVRMSKADQGGFELDFEIAKI